MSKSWWQRENSDLITKTVEYLCCKHGKRLRNVILQRTAGVTSSTTWWPCVEGNYCSFPLFSLTQNFRFSHWFNSHTQSGYSLGKLGCYADSLPDQFSLDMDPGKNPSYKKWRFHAESKPSNVQLFGEERNLNKNLKATMTKMNCSRTRYYLFIHLMDSYKYKYRCITIGHKSPTWLIHPHPAP